jgi:hypothetical protein
MCPHSLEAPMVDPSFLVPGLLSALLAALLAAMNGHK